MLQKIYYPYKADDGKHKYYIITKNNRRVYFGGYGYHDYTLYFKEFGKKYADEKKKAYIARHKANENWTKSGIDTAGWWCYKYLWSYPTKEEAYEKIKKFINI